MFAASLLQAQAQVEAAKAAQEAAIKQMNRMVTVASGQRMAALAGSLS